MLSKIKYATNLLKPSEVHSLSQSLHFHKPKDLKSVRTSVSHQKTQKL